MEDMKLFMRGLSLRQLGIILTFLLFFLFSLPVSQFIMKYQKLYAGVPFLKSSTSLSYNCDSVLHVLLYF